MAIDGIEELGLKVLALIKSGKLEAFKCALCSEEMQKDRNCECEVGLGKKVHAHPMVGEFDTCPIKFISNSIYSFDDKYRYNEKHPSSVPSYEDAVSRFWEAEKFFDDFLYKLEKEELENPQVDDNENMSKMAKLFNINRS